MTKANCKEIQRELDEMMLEADYGVQVSTHLRECSECRDFQEKQLKLRQIVGSLGTVPAPPDFDFKLRARLANENASSGFHLSNLLGFGQRSAAIATAVVLVIGAIVFVRYLAVRNSTPPTIAGVLETVPITPTPQPNPSESVVAPNENPGVAVNPSHITSNPTNVPGRQETGNRQPRTRPKLVAQDSHDIALTAAEVVRSQSVNDGEQVFPIDASQQSLKVSLFDGRGNAKTISLPPVTFGSQRVVPTSTSYAPKGVW